MENTDLKEVEECSRWSELLPEVFQLISSKAFIDDPGSIGLMRTICKSWCSMSKSLAPPQFDTNPSKKYPLLMAYIEDLCIFYHPFTNNTFMMRFYELSQARIRYVKSEWLLIGHQEGYLFFNLSTKETIDIPINPSDSGFIDDSFVSMCCNEPPTSPNCYVIGVHRSGLMCYSMSNGELDRLRFNIFNSFEPAYCPPVFLGGNCCILSRKGNLGLYNLERKSFQIVEDCLLEMQGGLYETSYLLEDEGNLLALLVDEQQPKVDIKAMDGDGVWRPVQSLRNKMVFITYSLSCIRSAPVRSMGNKIFFPKFKHGGCVFYSLDTRRYHSFFGDYWHPKSPCALEWARCVWIDYIPSESSDKEE